MSWNPVTWFEDVFIDNPLTAASSALTNWITSLGGDIASGIEGAAVAILGDIWDVIVGPLEIIVGAFIMILVLGWAMKNQLIDMGALAIMAVK